MHARRVAVALGCLAIAIASLGARDAFGSQRPARGLQRKSAAAAALDRELAMMEEQQRAQRRSAEAIQRLRDRTERGERDERLVLVVVVALGASAIAYDSWRKKQRGGAPVR